MDIAAAGHLTYGDADRANPGVTASARARWLAWSICGLGWLLLPLTLALIVANRNQPHVWSLADPFQIASVIIYGVAGVLIATRRPGNAIGWVFLASCLDVSVGLLTAQWGIYALETNSGMPGGALALWLSLAFGGVTFSMFPLILFPTGRLPDWRAKTVACLTAIASVSLVVGLLTGNVYPPGFPSIYASTPNPMALEHPIGDPGISILALGVCLVLAIGLLLARFRRSQGLERQQYKWVVLELAVVVLAYVADFVARASGSGWYVVTNPLMSLSIAMVPVVMTLAILRYRLWDIDVVISRTLVYLALSASVVGIYVFIVGWLGTRFHTGGNLFFSLLATGVVAVLFQPLRERIQRGVNHLLYGERDEPYAVVSRLGRRLDESFAPGAVLPAIAATVREALKLPYTAVVLWNGAEQPLEVASGEPVPHPLRLPLVYQQEAVGELLIAPRARGESFNQADQRLLNDLARQAGIALHAVRLNHDLQQARERLVDAREEERRRLRRDLHDGLGSKLVALYLQWNALRVLIDTDPDAAQREVVELRGQLQAAIASVRELVHGLRPPAIDELGLLVALRERVRRFESPDLLVEIDLPNALPDLPAAVEVAVYRIVEEALTNVTTHAQATWCAARLLLGEVLAIVVEDNGAGMRADARSGVGLQSMRERAEELGGHCRIESRPGGGTRVAIQLPIGRTPRHDA